MSNQKIIESILTQEDCFSTKEDGLLIKKLLERVDKFESIKRAIGTVDVFDLYIHIWRNTRISS